MKPSLVSLSISLIAVAVGAISCTPSVPEVDYGIISAHSGYVPARIAVMPCSIWPNGARFRSVPLTNTKAIVTKELCDELDKFVLQGFKDQPYMRGFSPKWVHALTKQSKSEHLVDDLAKHWDHREGDCITCDNAPSFYESSLKNRTDWRLWLTELSKAVRHADAVLLPFVTHAAEQHYVDRGLFVSKRSAGVTMLLVDTNQGYLLWSGHRDSFALNQELERQQVVNAVGFPTWATVYERLLVEDVWKDFPGRQTYK